ncbi:hypothetical protein [Hyphomicrobium sp. LHD-15]|uniref:hypothetical protein n=1 Tax=Hyphomicrobium sp. LHD-15 TaxID=3072142 RepID=UPI00280CFBC4|nr:hypothetical protein [Hyphomicrobium sp. LHD-15]MDQ8698990.1 hypothetical protein [Hyphomicrobium sp. LHD-15]
MLAIFLAAVAAAASPPAEAAPHLQVLIGATDADGAFANTRPQGEDQFDEEAPKAFCQRLSTIKFESAPADVARAEFPKPDRHSSQPRATPFLSITHQVRDPANTPRGPPSA